MCVFCTAIPTSIVLGVAQNTKQKAEKDAALLEGLEPPKHRIPAGPATAIVVAGLLTASVIYHTTQGG